MSRAEKAEANMVHQLVACVRAQVETTDTVNRTLRTILCAPDPEPAMPQQSLKGMVAWMRRVSWQNERMVEQLARVTVHDHTRAHWLHTQADGASLHWCSACSQHLCASCANICSVIHDAQLAPMGPT
jgi:hypothetical protein